MDIYLFNRSNQRMDQTNMIDWFPQLFAILLNTDLKQTAPCQHHPLLNWLLYSANYVQTAETGWNTASGGAAGKKSG